MSTLPIVHILRAGAPEKVGLTGKLYNIEFHDNVNLRNLDVKYIIDEVIDGNYFLPSDEEDYDFVENSIPRAIHKGILLARSDDWIIPAYLVKKDSPIYRDWNDKLTLRYPKTQFIDDLANATYIPNKVYKSNFESGSRGVVVNPTKSEFDEFIQHKSGSAGLIQELVPKEYNNYFTFDFQLKNSKLLGYCFVNIPSGQYPRWLNGYIIRNKNIDKLIEELAYYLINVYQITDGFFNVDGAANSDYSDLYMYEINWRYSGLGNTLRAFGIDIIQNYLYNIPYWIPYGTHHYSYYYTPILLNDRIELRK